ncbi:MAG: TolC family protein, partial [Planctomycetota bacterium]
MNRAALAALLALAACSSAPPPVETDFAEALLARSAPIAAAAPGGPEPRPEPDPESRPEPAAPVVDDEVAVRTIVSKPFGVGDFARLAMRRSEAVAVARAKLEAARTGYRQAADLDDLASLYRSFSRDLDTRVGPPRHRRPVEAVASPPGVNALSGEIADRQVALARERLRSVEFDVEAAARRAHATVAWWAESKRIVAEDLDLMEGLLTVLLARLEAGQADQAGYLAFSAAVARRRTDLAVLEDRAPSLRARLNRLLARAEDAPLSLDLVPEAGGAGSIQDEDEAVVERARAESPATRMASLRAERAAIAVRMAETMTRPRFDTGSSRYERERAGEAGVDRGPVFPEPGRMTMPRPDYGVREAQATEMRARAEALAAAARDARFRTAATVRDALFAVTAANRRKKTLTEDIVPLARLALRASRGAYEGNRSGYLDLLEAARRLVRARLDRAGATRDVAVARADLLVAAGFDPG